MSGLGRVSTGQRTLKRAGPKFPVFAARDSPAAAWFVADSALEGTGFEPSVPRDTTNLSMSPLVASRQPKSRSEREPAHEASGPSPAEPMVRILFPPAESPCLIQPRPLQVENRWFRAGVRRSVGGAVGRRRAGRSKIAPKSSNISVGPYSSITLQSLRGKGIASLSRACTAKVRLAKHPYAEGAPGRLGACWA
jgi:hypothetical protein